MIVGSISFVGIIIFYINIIKLTRKGTNTQNIITKIYLHIKFLILVLFVYTKFFKKSFKPTNNKNVTLKKICLVKMCFVEINILL